MLRPVLLHRAALAAVISVPLGLAGAGAALAAGELTGPTATAGLAVRGVANGGDGGVVAVGQSSSGMLVQRVSAAGVPATPFAAGGGIARGVGVQADGKIVVAGSESGLAVRRFNADGTPDATFGGAGSVARPGGIGNALVLGPTCGVVTVAGTDSTAEDGFPRVAVFRYLANGQPDTSYGTAGAAIVTALGRNARARAMALQPDGKLIIAGDRAPGLQVVDAFIARLNADGSLDTTFANGGVYDYFHPYGGANSSFSGVAVDPSGRIVATGTDVRDDNNFAIFVRLLSNGAGDPSFDGDGYNALPSSRNYGNGVPVGPEAVAIAGQGEIVAGGYYQSSGLRSPALWVLRADGTADTSLAPDGTLITPSEGLGAQTNALVVAADGTLVSGGQTLTLNPPTQGTVARRVGFGAPPTPVGCAAPPPVVTPPVVTPPAKPAVSAVKLSSRFVTPRKSANLSFTLNVASKVVVSIEQQIAGRKRAGKCVAGLTKGVRCLSYKALPAKRTLSAKAGVTQLTVGRVFAARPLKAGTYRLVITPAGGSAVRAALAVRAR